MCVPRLTCLGESVMKSTWFVDGLVTSAWPGKREHVWPSSPIPQTTQSKTPADLEPRTDFTSSS